MKFSFFVSLLILFCLNLKIYNQNFTIVRHIYENNDRSHLNQVLAHFVKKKERYLKQMEKKYF